MLILLDCRPLQQERPESEKRRFIISCLTVLSGELGVEWLFLADGGMGVEWLAGIPHSQLLRKRTIPGTGGWKLWYDWQIPATVKRYKPDLVMTTGGVAAGRLRVPQCVWMPERAAGKGPGKKNYGRIYQKRLEGSLLQAQTIFTFSAKDKEFFISRSAAAAVAGKIFVVPVAPDEGGDLTAGEKSVIKGAYAEGKEYFFTDVAGVGQKEVVELLKSFSLFKKRQRSNMQLVLAGKDPASDKPLADLLATYKYREDIHWAGYLSLADGFRLAGSSYAIVFPFDRDNLGIHLLNAWKAGVPVITTSSACLPEMAGEAVMYAQPGDQASLAGQLMLIYKDESLRSRLIGKGREQGRSFSRERSIGEVWAGITAALTGFTSKISKSAINN
jgi:glycosyltransferase involved in cell wall biosynthesis